jgi:hypothetical protein
MQVTGEATHTLSAHGPSSMGCQLFGAALLDDLLHGPILVRHLAVHSRPRARRGACRGEEPAQRGGSPGEQPLSVPRGGAQQHPPG